MSQLVIKANFVPPEVLEKREAILDRLETTTKSQIQWYQCNSPAKYRQMRKDGTNGFVKPQKNSQSRDITIPTKDGRQIGLHIITPSGHSNGVILHFHAGGFVMGNSHSYDPYLTKLADGLSMSVASVEYRLAPEHPYPASQLDCLDAALYALSTEGSEELGGSLSVLAGESAGGYLAIWVALALRDDYGIDVRSKIKALIPSCGIFDLTYTPSVLSHNREVILSREGTLKFVEAAFGKISPMERKAPKVSPMFANLSDMPAALFLVGTADPLLDDSLFMAAKWYAAGNGTELRLVPGACHAFTLFPLGEVTDEGLLEIVNFVKQMTS